MNEEDKTMNTADSTQEDQANNTAAAAADAAEAAEVRADQRLGEIEAELAEVRSALLYARAETQNIRRRAEKEAADARTYAATQFARDVLSVSDNLSRALDAIPAELREDEKLKGLVTGLEATARELESVFSRHGITRIATAGAALDPNQHQAMFEVPTADAAPGMIVQEIQAGYMIKDRLLRPALVGVAKAPDA